METQAERDAAWKAKCEAVRQARIAQAEENDRNAEAAFAKAAAKKASRFSPNPATTYRGQASMDAEDSIF